MDKVDYLLKKLEEFKSPWATLFLLCAIAFYVVLNKLLESFENASQEFKIVCLGLLLIIIIIGYIAFKKWTKENEETREIVIKRLKKDLATDENAKQVLSMVFNFASLLPKKPQKETPEVKESLENLKELLQNK